MQALTYASLVAFALVSIATAIEVAGPGPAPALIKIRDVYSDTEFEAFEKRQACVFSACTCNRIQGEFCGNQLINNDCINGHEFFCFADGTTCDTGFEARCLGQA